MSPLEGQASGARALLPILPQGIIEIVRVLHERMEPSRHVLAYKAKKRS